MNKNFELKSVALLTGLKCKLTKTAKLKSLHQVRLMFRCERSKRARALAIGEWSTKGKFRDEIKGFARSLPLTKS